MNSKHILRRHRDNGGYVSCRLIGFRCCTRQHNRSITAPPCLLSPLLLTTRRVRNNKQHSSEASLLVGTDERREKKRHATERVLHTLQHQEMKAVSIPVTTTLALFCFGGVSSWNLPTNQPATRPTKVQQHDDDLVTLTPTTSRREWIAKTAAVLPALSILGASLPNGANAADALMTTPATPLEMKSFIDPQGLFSLKVPSTFFTLRRTVKGDLPDAKTGKGRRGSSIFTGGNMAKAEVVAVERYPTRVLLEENGIEATGDLSTFTAIGDPTAVASLLIIRREKETQMKGVKQLDNVKVSEDGKELTFRLRTEIDVQKPELLLEQYGISQLFRITVAKATLNSEDGNLFAIFASALESDFNNGVDGPALEETVNSFMVTKQQPEAA